MRYNYKECYISFWFSADSKAVLTFLIIIFMASKKIELGSIAPTDSIVTENLKQQFINDKQFCVILNS